MAPLPCPGAGGLIPWEKSATYNMINRWK
jgi:hypothetical protein